MLDRREQGIERFIQYIRRMNQLDDEQMSFMLKMKIEENPEYYTSVGTTIEGHIQFIRSMAKLTDDQMRKWLRHSANTDPVMREIFEDAAKKKAISDMKKMAKDIKSDAKSFARKVDRDLE